MSQQTNLVRYSLLATVAATVGAPGTAAAVGMDITDITGNYYIAFVDDAGNGTGYQATSTSAADYNTIVNTDAAAAGSILPSATYNAFVSTPTVGQTPGVSALANIGCTSGACFTATPIYEVIGLDGSTPVVVEVADSLSDFLGGTIINNLNTSQYGVQKTGYYYVWTGSNADGTPDVGHEVGTSFPEFGTASIGGGTFFSQVAASFDVATNKYGLYGFSTVLSNQTGTIIPEPSSPALLAVGAGLLAVMRRRRPAA